MVTVELPNEWRTDASASGTREGSSRSAAGASQDNDPARVDSRTLQLARSPRGGGPRRTPFSLRLLQVDKEQILFPLYIWLRNNMFLQMRAEHVDPGMWAGCRDYGSEATRVPSIGHRSPGIGLSSYLESQPGST